MYYKFNTVLHDYPYFCAAEIACQFEVETSLQPQDGFIQTQSVRERAKHFAKTIVGLSGDVQRVLVADSVHGDCYMYVLKHLRNGAVVEDAEGRKWVLRKDPVFLNPNSGNKVIMATFYLQH